VRSLRHIVGLLPSSANAATFGARSDDALTTGLGATAGRTTGFSVSRSSQILPCPPSSPALTTNSIDWNCRSVRSDVGPHANSIWRRLMRTCCHSPGNE
jgi:hypothetical protein